MKTSLQLLPIAFAALALSPSAHAVLGGAASTVEVDRMQMKAAVPAASNKINYTVHEMTLPSGVSVREYIANDKVFAVAWRGRIMPDLKQLMGPYFDTYTSEARSHGNGHTHVAIEHPELVVHAAGHMRAYAGSAYIPSMLPEGIKASEIQ
ncbi:MAG: DUF2844 domain-containing protein [Burkholderiaceae bacterium]|nr:DUF2844 domain-containing protein [Burkholderiaceae bacterium]